MTRRGLGRGLDALLPSMPAQPEGEQARPGIYELAIADIRPNPRQPRKSFDDDALAELAASVRVLGVLQPIVVRRGDHGYEMVAGERRWRAAQLAGLDKVPVVLVETDARGSLERALVENIHRADLNPIEEAAAYRQLLDEGGLTHAGLGERIGRNRVSISNALRLLDLPFSVQTLIAEGRLTSGHGKSLLALEGNPFLERLARRAAEEGWSTRETEEQIRRYQAMSGAARPATAPGEAHPAGVEMQKRLADHLQTRVRIEMGKRKGRIVLDFVSQDELERLASIILGERAGARTTIAMPE